ncbi:hypothetical protein BMS3Abin07_01341 [bacterium BMS3Abin07]|nr:hypothetical protein BMS3Abin07_01341 [bacterium BMS3Abin07]GBE33071.1 hypothetical protein BMS3Bbin05_02006 [bacterium BMS3Bbin05]
MKKLLITVVSFLTMITFAYADGPNNGYVMGPWMMGWGYGMGWFWPVLMIAFWIAVIVVIIILIRWIVLSSEKGHGIKPDETALEVLKKRYVKGEIDREEFERIKRDIA